MPGENARKLLASLAGKKAEAAPSNRQELIAELRSALKSEDDEAFGDALDAYVGNFIDETEEV
jgi:hypothetical protein